MNQGLLQSKAPQGEQFPNKQSAGNPPQVDPAIQEQFDMFVNRGLIIIHNDKVSNDILNKVKSGGNIINGLAKTLVIVVERIESNAESAGVKIADEVKIAGANHLLSEIFTVAETAGVKLDERQKGEVFANAVSLYLDRGIKSGKITKEQLTKMAQDAQATPQGAEIAKQMQQQTQQPVQTPVQPVQGQPPQQAVQGGQYGQ